MIEGTELQPVRLELDSGLPILKGIDQEQQKTYSKKKESNEVTNELIAIFDPNELSSIKNFSMGIFAKRRSGKTVLLKYILSKIYKNYSECHVFSGTSTVQQEIYGFCDPSFVYDGYSEEILSGIITDSSAKIKEALKSKPDNVSESDFKTKLEYKMVILDDVISDKSLRYSKVLSDIFILGRHLNIAVVFLSQTVTGIPKSMRANLDIAAAFHLNNIKDSTFFIEQYFSDNGISYGRELMNKITQKNYNCIIVKNFVTSQNIYDRVFQITADANVKDFVVGNKSVAQSKGTTVDNSKMSRNITKNIRPVVSVKNMKFNFINE